MTTTANIVKCTDVELWFREVEEAHATCLSDYLWPSHLDMCRARCWVLAANQEQADGVKAEFEVPLC